MVLAKIRDYASAGLTLGRKAVSDERGWTPIGGTWSNWLPSAGRDYKKDAGDLHDNSIVLGCIKWQGRVWPEAPPIVQVEAKDGEWEKVKKHPYPLFLDTPNPWEDGVILWQATLLSLAVDGNAYWYILRSAAGKPAAYQYLPHFCIEPYRADGAIHTTHYRVMARDGYKYVPASEIVHLRDGKDPRNTLKGLSPLGAVLREVVADNEAATYGAAMLRNMGMPGVILSPKGGEANGSAGPLNPIWVNSFKETWKSKFGGENRGEPFLNGFPLDVSAPAFSPEQMALDHVRDIPEERVTAALGIPAAVVGFGTGLEQTTNRATVEELARWAWRHNIIPTQRLIACQLTRHAQAEGWLKPGERLAFDLSQVHALQEDEGALIERLVKACGGPIMSLNEGRARVNLPPVPEGDEIRQPMPALAPGDQPKPGDKPKALTA